MKVLSFLSVVLGVFIVALSEAAVEYRSVELPFTPYSSTYHAFNTGYIFKNMSPHFEYASWVKPSIVEQLKTKSTIERFDEGRKLIFPTSSPITSEIQKTHYTFGQDPGAGRCHQYTMASLDPFVAEQIEKTQGMLCGETLLTYGELKELFSALYNPSGGAIRYGAPTGVEFLSGFSYDVRKKLGLDDLNAHDFHVNIYQELAQERGVAIDTTPTWATNNHPIYHMGSTIETLDTKQGAFEYINLIPSIFYSSENSQLQAHIQEALKLENLFKKYLIYEFVNYHYAHLFYENTEQLVKEKKQLEKEIEKAWRPHSGFFKKMFFNTENMLDDLLKERDKHVQHYILPALQNGTVHFDPEIVVKRVTSTISYGDYNYDYANPKNHSKSTTYEYVLFEKNSVPIGSAWLSLPKHRPDFIWLMTVSQVMDPPSSQDRIYMHALKDLYQMTRYCTPVSDIKEFIHSLELATEDRHIDEDEKFLLKGSYQKLQVSINKDFLKEWFSQRNLSWDIFDHP